MKFKVVEYSDRQDWLQWRQNGVGSSDVPVIMGVSRFKDYDTLLQEKVTREVIEDQRNQYVKDRGNRIEKSVRDFYGTKMGMEFNTLICESIEKEYLRASLDGIDAGHNIIIEIKLMSSQQQGKTNDNAEGLLKWGNAKKNGVIPEDYYPQIQHQLSVTGAPVCMFIGLKEVRVPGKAPAPITEEDLAIVSVLPDDKYIEKMNTKIDEFWNKVLTERKKNEQDSNSTSS